MTLTDQKSSDKQNGAAENMTVIRRDIFRLAWPVTVENILQMTVGLVAMAMVGRLGATSIAAVGLVNRFTQLIWALFAAIGTGATVLIAQSTGAGNQEESRRIARSSLWMALIFMSATTLPVYLFARQALMVFNPQPDLLAVATSYFRISIWSVPFMVITMLTASILRGMGNTRTPMLIALGANVINAACQYVLIFGLGSIPAMGLNGSALAIVIAQACGALVSIGVLFRAFYPLSFLSATKKPGMSRKVLKVGVPAAAEHLCWQVAAFIVTRLIVGLGNIPMAAHQLGLQAEAISYMPSAGLGIATTALIGQSLGAGRPQLAKKYASELVRWAIVITALAASVLLFLPKQFLSLLTTDREVIELAAVYLMLMGLGQSPQNIASVFNGALRGAGDTRTPMYIALAGLWFIRIPLAMVLSKPFGVKGVWLAITVDLFFRFSLSLWRYLPGNWYKKPRLYTEGNAV